MIRLKENRTMTVEEAFQRLSNVMNKRLATNDLDVTSLYDVIRNESPFSPLYTAIKTNNETEHVLWPYKDQIKKLLDDGMSKKDIHCMLQKETSELECHAVNNFTVRHKEKQSFKTTLAFVCIR